MTAAPPLPASRVLPLGLVHGAIGAIDLAWVAGEGIWQAITLVFGLIAGSRSLIEVAQGVVQYVFLGNTWFPIAHAICLLMVLFRTRWGWRISAVLLAARALFTLVNGSPYLHVAAHKVPLGFTLFMGALFILGGLAHLWHGIPRPPPSAGS